MFNSIQFLIPVVYAAFNIFSFVLYGTDKLKAKKEKWRISEQFLLIASLLGPLGAWIGMQHFRHKTRKPIFKLLVPLFIGVHIVLALWIVF